jgi:uncharacterized protein YraI
MLSDSLSCNLVFQVSPPEAGVPTATTIDNLNLRSGPGAQYPSCGITPRLNSIKSRLTRIVICSSNHQHPIQSLLEPKA